MARSAAPCCPPAGPAWAAGPCPTSRRGRGGGRRCAAPGTTAARGRACRSRSRPARRRAGAPCAGPPRRRPGTRRSGRHGAGRDSRRGSAPPAPPGTAEVRKVTSSPAAAHSEATLCACSSEPPASGSSRSRQATKWMRRSPASAAIDASTSRSSRPCARRRRHGLFVAFVASSSAGYGAGAAATGPESSPIRVRLALRVPAPA